MAVASEGHRRRSIRLKGYDYAGAGAYFVTLCTQDRAPLFGEIADGGMRLNATGEIVREEWTRSAHVRPGVELDAFVVMPNHIHGIVVIAGGHPDGVGATRRVAPTNVARGPAPRSIGAIIGQFKSIATKRIRQQRGAGGLVVWQRNYHEHIIRNEGSLNCIRQYIIDNPARWAMDRDNPRAISPEGRCPWDEVWPK